jgi:tripartite-type tricarboxylate transporter receptor subunit TctC
MLSKRLILSAIATASVCLLGSGAEADQPYPNRPVRIIVAGVPGTAFDLIARAVAGKLATSLKQTFLVETRPGAAGNLGAEFVAKAAADGYTLLIALGTTFTVNPSLYKKLPYDPERDLRPITITAKASTMLVVHPSVPVYSVPEFVAFAKQEPVSYAHGGHGSPGHLSMEYFRLQAGFGTVPVPYRGNAPLVTDLVAGQIKFGFVGTAGVVPHVVAGRLRALAISAGQRSTLAPDVPTMVEAGYPNFKVETYYVISAPAGTPEPIVALLEHEIRQALKSSDLQETFRPQDIEILATTGAEAKARLKSDAELWAKVVNATGMHVD